MTGTTPKPEKPSSTSWWPALWAPWAPWRAPPSTAGELLAIVAGQGVERGDDGPFRIVAKVTPDRLISVVDPEARHGHKSRNRHFDS